jgi:phosphatidylglycerol:prolipoprotein diacylglycerol transferase
MALARARGRRAGIDPLHLSRLFLVILLTAVVGSRLLYVAEHAAAYAADPWRVVRLSEGGLSMYGGLGLALVASVLYARTIGVPFAVLADVCAPSLALGEALTRIGCFLNGCCFGIPSNLPWGVTFPDASPAGHAFPDTALHPAQLYAALWSLLVLGLLVHGEQRRHRPGRVNGLFLVLQAAGRLTLELVRHHEPSAVLADLGALSFTTYQSMSLALLAAGACLVAARASEVSHGTVIHRRR